MSTTKSYVTNNHIDPMEFQVAGGGTKIVEPGETEHFALLDPNSPQNIANQHAGLVSISDKDPSKSSDKQQSSPSGTAAAS